MLKSEYVLKEQEKVKFQAIGGTQVVQPQTEGISAKQQKDRNALLKQLLQSGGKVKTPCNMEWVGSVCDKVPSGFVFKN